MPSGSTADTGGSRRLSHGSKHPLWLCRRITPSASASTSITSRPSATRAAAGIPIRCARRSSRSRPAPTASPRICARIAATSATTTSRGSRRELTKPLNLEMAATPTRWSRSRVRHAAARRLPRSRAARGAHHRGRPRCRRQRDRACAARSPALRGAGIRVSLFIAADPAQIEAAAATRRAGDRDPHRRLVRRAVRRRRRRGRGAELRAHRARARRWPQSARPRGPCRPRPRLRQRRSDRGAARDRRAQHRPFPDRRGGVRRPCRGDATMRAAMDRGRARAAAMSAP